MSSDFFYEPPDWFRSYRPGRMDSALPWKTESKFIGLEIYRQGLDIESNNSYQPLHGWRMIIHNTNEFPFRTGQHLLHKKDEGLFILYTPTLTAIDNALKKWQPEQRNCFMENEKSLKYFRIYTQSNCEHECLSDAMLQLCGCVSFYMIREL